MSEKEEEEEKPESLENDEEDEAPGEPTPEGVYTCKYCGATESPKYGKFNIPARIAQHTRFECEEFAKRKKKKAIREARIAEEAIDEVRQEQPTVTPAPSPDELSPRQRVAMYGEDELDNLKKESLIRFLQAAPKVGAGITKWVVQQWDLDPSIRENPQSLLELLRDAGIKMNIAYRAVTLLQNLEDEMADVLDYRQPMPPITSRRRRSPPPRYGDYDRRYRREEREPEPWTWPSRGGRRDDYDRDRYDDYRFDVRREIDRETRALREKIDDLKEELKESRRTPADTASQNIEIYKPRTDSQGNILVDQAGRPIQDRVIAPIHLADKVLPQKDPTESLLRIVDHIENIRRQEQPMQPGESELTAEKVRSIIKEEKEHITPEQVGSIIERKLREAAPSGPDPQMVEMGAELKGLKERLESQKDAMSKERYDRIEEELHKTQQQLSQMRTGEYSEDGMKLLSQSMDKVADVLDKRKPFEKAMDKVFPDMPGIPDEMQPHMMQQQVQPQRRQLVRRVEPVKPTEQAKKTAETAMEKLEKEGYVAEK